MQTAQQPWYLIKEIDKIDTPALVIYRDRVLHNISLAIEMAGDVDRLRPHVKTHKSAQVTELMLQAGITKFKCATIAEAEMLGRCKAPDVLLAYQPAGPKISRLLVLIQAFPATRFSCLVDDVTTATNLSYAAVTKGMQVDVFLDINIGMNRTGIHPGKAMDLYIACKELPGLHVVGLHGYDGHIADKDLALRKRRADDAYAQIATVKDALQKAGFLDPVLVIGGSPGFPIHAARKGVECSPGTFVYWDQSYSAGLPDMKFLPAALVVSRVVSVVNEKTICLDLGHKSIAAENPLANRVNWLGVEELTPVGHSEEHLVMESKTAMHCKIGEVFYGVPFHVCPTIALYDIAFVIEAGNVKEEWEMIARRRKISI